MTSDHELLEQRLRADLVAAAGSLTVEETTLSAPTDLDVARRRRRPRWTWLVAAASALLVAGTTVGAVRWFGPDPARPAAGPITDARVQALMGDFRAVQQGKRRLDRQVDRRVDVCMARHGLYIERGRGEPDPQTSQAGLRTEDEARRDGYRITEQILQDRRDHVGFAPAELTGGSARAAYEGTSSPAQHRIPVNDWQLDSDVVPAEGGGCWGEAMRAVWGADAQAGADLSTTLANRYYVDLQLTDWIRDTTRPVSETRDVGSRWAACMHTDRSLVPASAPGDGKSLGEWITLSTQDAAGAGARPRTLTTAQAAQALDRERRLAVLDVRCSSKVGLSDAVREADAFQGRWVLERAPETDVVLRDYRAVVDRVLARNGL